MGYEVQAKTARIIFEDSDLEGLEVVCKSVPLSVYLKVAKLGEGGGADLAMAEETMRLFAEEVLESWNLLDAGEAIPATYEGMLSVKDVMLPVRIMQAWARGLVNVPAPLEDASSNGAQPPSGIPMEELSATSESQPN